MYHTGVGWVMQGWGGSYRGGVGYEGWGESCRGGVGHESVGWGGSCRGAVGHAFHVGVGWGELITHTVSKIHKWI